MARITLIRAGSVENVIEADMAFAEGLGYDFAVESDAAGIGWQYIGGEFIAPTPAGPEPEIPPNRRITRLAFRNRFTQAELVALEIAGLDDPSAPMQQRQQAAAIRVMQRQVGEATFIDLDRPDTRAGVQQLEVGGLIASGRALEILDAPVQPMEAYSA